jgi:hypothetical protein
MPASRHSERVADASRGVRKSSRAGANCIRAKTPASVERSSQRVRAPRRSSVSSIATVKAAGAGLLPVARCGSARLRRSEVRRGPPWPLWSQRAPLRHGPRNRRPSPNRKGLASALPDRADLHDQRNAGCRKHSGSQKFRMAECFERDRRPCSPVRGSEMVAGGPIPPRRSV